MGCSCIYRSANKYWEAGLEKSIVRSILCISPRSLYVVNCQLSIKKRSRSKVHLRKHLPYSQFSIPFTRSLVLNSFTISKFSWVSVRQGFFTCIDKILKKFFVLTFRICNKSLFLSRFCFCYSFLSFFDIAILWGLAIRAQYIKKSNVLINSFL